MKKIAILITVYAALISAACGDNEIFNSAISTQNVSTRQSYNMYGDYITPCEASNLTYFIDESCAGSDYVTAIADATSAYNNLGISIHFSPAATANDADLVFNCVNGGNCGQGITNGDGVIFPSGGKIINAVELNINWSGCRCLESMPDNFGCTYPTVNMPCVLQRTVMHEIGHALGLVHNDEGDNIPGTPDIDYDENSVFNDGDDIAENCDFCNPSCSFNQNDINALSYIYPPCLKAPKISVTFDPCNSLIYLYETNNPLTIRDSVTQYDWSISGLNNSYLLSNNANPAVVRVLFGPDEELCVNVTVSNEFIDQTLECASTTCKEIVSTQCQVCFVTPDCDGHGSQIIGVISNSCSAGATCPEGYTCVSGICCPASPPVDSCVTNLDCGVGFQCVNGVCIPVQGDGCVTNNDCPPGMRCKNGVCI